MGSRPFPNPNLFFLVYIETIQGHLLYVIEHSAGINGHVGMVLGVVPVVVRKSKLKISVLFLLSGKQVINSSMLILRVHNFYENYPKKKKFKFSYGVEFFDTVSCHINQLFHSLLSHHYSTHSTL